VAEQDTVFRRNFYHGIGDMGSSNHNSDDTTFVIVLVVLSMIILLAVPFCVWVYMETVEQRAMVEVSIRKFNRMQQQQLEKDKVEKEKTNTHD
jgi:hypothetical protein